VCGEEGTLGWRAIQVVECIGTGAWGRDGRIFRYVMSGLRGGGRVLHRGGVIGSGDMDLGSMLVKRCPELEKGGNKYPLKRSKVHIQYLGCFPCRLRTYRETLECGQNTI
jgi:hypothetical protein